MQRTQTRNQLILHAKDIEICIPKRKPSLCIELDTTDSCLAAFLAEHSSLRRYRRSNHSAYA